MSKRYTSDAITVRFDAERCIHARTCVLTLNEVFDPGARPWIQPGEAHAEAVAATVRRCPSGALSYERHDGGLEETPPKINRIAVQENGPLVVAGDLDIDGEAATRAVICRCGASETKPFCNNAHVDMGFEATGEPATEAKKEGSPGEGGLSIEALPDGPLKVEGPMELVSGTGHRLGVMNRAFLCRCGLSRKKPFCDGSHNGFKTSD